jgi:hypothetical protein
VDVGITLEALLICLIWCYKCFLLHLRESLQQQLGPVAKVLLLSTKGLLPTATMKGLLPATRVWSPDTKSLLPTTKGLLPTTKGLLPTTKVCYPLRKFCYPAKKGGHSSTSTAQELPKTPQAPIGDLPPGPQTFLRWADKIFAS